MEQVSRNTIMDPSHSCSDDAVPKHLHLMGGTPRSSSSSNDFDSNVQRQLSHLLLQWGSDIVDDKKRATAKAEVERLKQEKKKGKNPYSRASASAAAESEPVKKENDLFIYNPYRPQGGMGFPGTPMWESLLGELPAELSAEQKKNVARIFRVDPEHNAAVETKLEQLDAECEAISQSLVEQAKRGM